MAPPGWETGATVAPLPVPESALTSNTMTAIAATSNAIVREERDIPTILRPLVAAAPYAPSQWSTAPC